jgi:hypothetical protein
MSDAERKGYFLSKDDECDQMTNLIKFTGKKGQAPRIYKLYKLFSAITRKSDDETEHIGNIAEALLANWKNIPAGNKQIILNHVWFKRFFVDVAVSEFFISLGQSNSTETFLMMDKMEE